MDAVNLFDYRGQSFKALCKTDRSTADVFTLPAGHVAAMVEQQAAQKKPKPKAPSAQQ